MEELKSVILKKGREKSMVNRHPWIFSGALESIPDFKDGEIVNVFSAEKRFLGIGFFSPKSQISVRLFDFPKDENTIQIDENYWKEKIDKAYHLRKSFIDFSTTNCFRLVHAEGDFFPGLICDIYDNIAVIQILIKGTEKILPFIISGIKKIGIQHIYYKSKSSSKHLENIQIKEGFIEGGEDISTKIQVKEYGLNFIVDIAEGQKTGFFIDQRENRRILGAYSNNKKVLNTFSFSGGFSVFALQGGANEVISVDISKDAIQLCNENVELNPNHTGIHSGVSDDVFEYLQNIPDDFDIIVLDPPAFAKHARALKQASRGYKQINLQAFRKIKSGGLVMTFSCSQIIDKELFRKIVFAAAADAHRNVRIIEQLHQPLDHPINIYHPESEYLKGLLLYVE